jgi:hypothetical protein
VLMVLWCPSMVVVHHVGAPAFVHSGVRQGIYSGVPAFVRERGLLLLRHRGLQAQRLLLRALGALQLLMLPSQGWLWQRRGGLAVHGEGG